MEVKNFTKPAPLRAISREVCPSIIETDLAKDIKLKSSITNFLGWQIGRRIWNPILPISVSGTFSDNEVEPTGAEIYVCVPGASPLSAMLELASIGKQSLDRHKLHDDLREAKMVLTGKRADRELEKRLVVEFGMMLGILRAYMRTNSQGLGDTIKTENKNLAVGYVDQFRYERDNKGNYWEYYTLPVVRRGDYGIHRESITKEQLGKNNAEAIEWVALLARAGHPHAVIGINCE